MYSVTMQMGLCSIHSPNNWTKCGWRNFVMTLASRTKSASDMVPSFINLTATSAETVFRRLWQPVTADSGSSTTRVHFPLRTTPNWPDPSSSRSVSSLTRISQDLSPHKLNLDRRWLESLDDGLLCGAADVPQSDGTNFNLTARDPASCRW